MANEDFKNHQSFTNIINVVTSKSNRWTKHVPHIEKTRHA